MTNLEAELDFDSDDDFGSGGSLDIVDCTTMAAIFGKHFLIWPDKTETCMRIYPTRKTWITVKGEESVCGVSLDPTDDHFFQTRIYAYEVAFCRGTPEADGAGPSPFAQVGLFLSESCGEIQRFMDLEASVLSRHEATRGELKAINYLENKAKRCALPSHQETIQTAIIALKYLLEEEDFKADELTVYVVGKNLWIDEALTVKDIEYHLEAIRNGSSSESSTEEKIEEQLAVSSNESSSREEGIPLLEHLALS